MKVHHDSRRPKDPKEVQREARKIASKGGGSASEAKGAASFGQNMALSMEASQEALDTLMKTVDETGDVFLRDPSEPSLIAYTNAVRDFMRKVMKEAFAVEKMFDRHNRLYTVVREVDEKLAKMTDEVITGQVKAMELASRIQEIRGVLLDMYI